jgi:hypothetical protein
MAEDLILPSHIEKGDLVRFNKFRFSLDNYPTLRDSIDRVTFHGQPTKILMKAPSLVVEFRIPTELESEPALTVELFDASGTRLREMPDAVTLYWYPRQTTRLESTNNVIFIPRDSKPLMWLAFRGAPSTGVPRVEATDGSSVLASDRRSLKNGLTSYQFNFDGLDYSKKDGKTVDLRIFFAGFQDQPFKVRLQYATRPVHAPSVSPTTFKFDPDAEDELQCYTARFTELPSLVPLVMGFRDGSDRFQTVELAYMAYEKDYIGCARCVDCKDGTYELTTYAAFGDTLLNYATDSITITIGREYRTFYRKYGIYILIGGIIAAVLVVAVIFYQRRKMKRQQEAMAAQQAQYVTGVYIVPATSSNYQQLA